MYILNEKVKNKYNHVNNLEYRNLDNNFYTKNYLKKGKLKHNPSSIKEWYNSVYSLEINNNIKTLPLKDIFVYKVFDTYFNLNKLKKHDNLSMGKIFIGKPEIKHFNNKIYITLYIFNKWVTYFYKMTGMIKTSNELFSLNNKQFTMLENKSYVMSALLLKHPKYDQKLIVFINKILTKIFSDSSNINNNRFIGILYTNLINFFNKAELYDLLRLINNEYGLDNKVKRYLYLYLCIINYFFNYIGFSKMINILKKILLLSPEEKKINNLKIVLEIYLRKLNFNSLYLLMGLIQIFCRIKKILNSMYIMRWYKRNVYYNRYKFSIKNILPVKNILSKLYNNKIEINVINLKYLYLDGNILALTVARKLKNRKRRVLKVIRMALRLSKKPYINRFYSDLLNINSLDNLFIKKDLNLSINNNIPSNKDLICKPTSYKSRIIFFYLKHKIISGMRLQGTGRLTKRLTASRSISKSMSKGSLKNKASSYNGLSTVVLRGYVKSNLQYINVNSYNRIGAYGIKSWVSSH